MNAKEQRLAAFLKARGYEGAWLKRRTNIAWLTDGADVHVDSSSSTGIASVLWTPRKKVVFCDNIEARRLGDEEFGKDWEVRAVSWWKRREVPVGNFLTDFPDDPLADARASLTDVELGRIRALGKRTAAELARVMKWAKRGMSEHEVAAELIAGLRKDGIVSPVVLVAADDRIAKYRHPIPTDRKISKTFMVAVCPRQYGLMVAMTRLAHFGKLPAALRRRHDAVCRVDAALHAATAPGQRWCDILGVGIQVYRETGFGEEWKLHHQGGPMGYEGRDYKATPTETRLVVEDQAVGWNPSITGTKSEDTILSSGEVITPTKNWPVCNGRPDVLAR